jgi:hypothetical protein
MLLLQSPLPVVVKEGMGQQILLALAALVAAALH